jgi:hypothetical protein
MMGEADPRRALFYNISLETFLPGDHPLPEEYKRRLRAEDREATDGPQDSGNRSVDFRGERRSNATHRSVSDPDCRYVSRGTSGTGAYPGYTVNALMENRHRILLGLGVETFAGGHRREARLSGAARPGAPTPAIPPGDARRRRGVLPRGLHRSAVRPRHRAAHRRGAAR